MQIEQQQLRRDGAVPECILFVTAQTHRLAERRVRGEHARPPAGKLPRQRLAQRPVHAPQFRLVAQAFAVGRIGDDETRGQRTVRRFLQVRYRAGDLFRSPFGGPYDVILASHVFHHFDERACLKLARKIARALKPGGRLVIQEFVYSLTFISSVEKMTVSVGVPVALVRGDVYYWGSLMAACLVTSVPIAIVYNFFLDRFIAGFTVGAIK